MLGRLVNGRLGELRPVNVGSTPPSGIFDLGVKKSHAQMRR